MRCPLEKVLVGIGQSFRSREMWGGWLTMSRVLRLAGPGVQSEGFGRRGGDQSPPGWPALVGCGVWLRTQQSLLQLPFLHRLFRLACSPFLEEASVWVVRYCCC